MPLTAWKVIKQCTKNEGSWKGEAEADRQHVYKHRLSAEQVKYGIRCANCRCGDRAAVAADLKLIGIPTGTIHN
jgi:hypothetical protein